MHGRAAAMVTPIGDKNTLLPAESAVSSSGCAGRGRVKRAARERTNGSTRGCRERSDAKVCASASVAEGPSATFNTSRGGTPSFSAPMGMGPGPKHIYTLTWGVPPRGHPSLSLDDYVTAVTAIPPWFTRAASHFRIMTRRYSLLRDFSIKRGVKYGVKT